MGGYTMTLDSSGNAQFDSNQIVNPGHFVTRGAGQFYIASSALFNHGPEHTITVGSTAYLSFYRNSLSNPFNWKVICAATTSTISFEMANTFAGEIMFDGDIEINSGCTCKFYVYPNATPFKLTGDISGEGDLSIGGSQVYLAGDNSYLGMMKGGYVYVASPTAIPDNSSSKLTSGINGFVFSSTDDGVGIKSDQVADFANGIWKATLEGTADKNFYVDEGGVVELDVDISDWKGSFYNKSNGTIAFTHTIASEQSLSFYHTGTMGGFRFSNPQGETSSIGSWTLNEGRLELLIRIFSSQTIRFTALRRVESRLVLSFQTRMSGVATSRIRPSSTGRLCSAAAAGVTHWRYCRGAGSRTLCFWGGPPTRFRHSIIEEEASELKRIIKAPVRLANMAQVILRRRAGTLP